MTGGKTSLFHSGVNLVLNLLSTQIELSCCHAYQAPGEVIWAVTMGKKKSQFSFTASCMKREATMQLEGQCFDFSSNQEQVHREKCKDKESDTVVRPPALVRNRLKRWRGWKSWKRACSLQVRFTLLSQADISPGAQGAHLLSRCFLLTFSDLNICSCMQRNNNVL